MIVHAMTRDGMLETPGAVATNLLTERVPTAELIFETLGTDDDYHTAMDSDRYLLWLENRLLPAFAAHYPGKRMTLVLDNAGYHHIHGYNWGTPSDTTMSPNACRSLAIIASAASTHRAARLQPPPSANATRNPRRLPTRPSCKRLYARTSNSHPGINRTEVEKLMTAHGHSLVYTPPFFVFQAQPIELAGHGEESRRAAVRAQPQREVTREQTESALTDVTAAQCSSYIAQAHAYLQPHADQRGAPPQRACHAAGVSRQHAPRRPPSRTHAPLL